MKKLIICSGIILILAILGFGQKQNQGSGINSKGNASGSVAIASGTRIDGQLQDTLDVKHAKVGDQVLLKTTKAIKQDGRTIVAKGSSLIGHITEVQQKTRSNAASRLGMVFDRIEGGSLAAPISASIVSITNASAGSTMDGTAETDLFGSSGTSVSSSSNTRVSSGSSGGLLSSVGNSVGSVAGSTTRTAGGVLNTTRETTGSVVNTAGSAVGSVGTTVNGLQISNYASGSAEAGTTISASDRNIRLEKGVTIQLQLNSSVRSQR